MVLMANRYILPAGLDYQKAVGSSVAAVKAAGSTSKEGKKLLDRGVKAGDTFRVVQLTPPGSAGTRSTLRHASA